MFNLGLKLIIFNEFIIDDLTISEFIINNLIIIEVD
jgi:hypothetical protein